MPPRHPRFFVFGAEFPSGRQDVIACIGYDKEDEFSRNRKLYYVADETKLFDFAHRHLSFPEIPRLRRAREDDDATWRERLSTWRAREIMKQAIAITLFSETRNMAKTAWERLSSNSSRPILIGAFTVSSWYLNFLCTDEGLPRVKHLLFEDGRITEEFKDIPQTRMLPSLHTITLQCLDDYNLPNFQNPLSFPFACFRCPNLERVVFDPHYFTPNSVVCVTHESFKYCPSLQHFGGPNAIGFDMPPGVWTKIDAFAFYGTRISRASFTWRTQIHWASFQKCTRLRHISFGPEEPESSWTTVLPDFFRANPDAQKIDNTLSNLRFMAFHNRDPLKIAWDAFAETAIERIVLPSYIEGVERYAFEYCLNLRFIALHGLWRSEPELAVPLEEDKVFARGVMQYSEEEAEQYAITKGKKRENTMNKKRVDPWFAVGCSALEVVVDLAPTSTALPLQYFTPYSEETLKARLKELYEAGLYEAEEGVQKPFSEWLDEQSYGPFDTTLLMLLKRVERRDTNPHYFVGCTSLVYTNVKLFRQLSRYNVRQFFQEQNKLAIPGRPSRPAPFIDWTKEVARLVALCVKRAAPVGQSYGLANCVLEQFPALTVEQASGQTNLGGLLALEYPIDPVGVPAPLSEESDADETFLELAFGGST
jgi:hypothetical protein